MTKNHSKGIDPLNRILANLQIRYQKLRGFHWKVSGSDFFEFHEKFEEFYTSTAKQIDLLAERVLTVGRVPLSTFREFLMFAVIEENDINLESQEMFEVLVDDNDTIIHQLKKTIPLMRENSDFGSARLLEDILLSLEKQSWMMNAWLAKSQERVLVGRGA